MSSVRSSLCLSYVTYTAVLCRNGYTCPQTFFTVDSHTILVLPYQAYGNNPTRTHLTGNLSRNYSTLRISERETIQDRRLLPTTKYKVISGLLNYTIVNDPDRLQGHFNFSLKTSVSETMRKPLLVAAQTRAGKNLGFLEFFFSFFRFLWF